jgi:hypothetical protein
MEIDYELTKDDLYAFQWRGAYTSPRARRMMWKTYLYWFIALFLLSILPAIGADGFSLSLVNISILLVTFPLVVLATWFLTRRGLRSHILQLLKDEKPEKGQLGMHRVVLEDSGIVETTAVNETSTAWAGIDRIEQDSDYIFIYTSQIQAHIIPKRAFKDAAEAEAFIEFSKARIITNTV